MRKAIVQFIKELLAPGIDESRNAEIYVLASGKGTFFQVDEKSFRSSKVVKRQVAALRQEKRIESVNSK